MMLNKKRGYTIGAQFFSCVFCGHVKVIQVNSKDKENSRILFCPVCGVKTTFKLTDPSLVEELPEEVKNLLKLKGKRRWRKPKQIVRKITEPAPPSYGKRQVKKLYDAMSTAMLMVNYGTRVQTFHVLAEAIDHLPPKRAEAYEQDFRLAMQPNSQKPFAPYRPTDTIRQRLHPMSCQAASTAMMAINATKLATRQSANTVLHRLANELTQTVSEDYHAKLVGELKEIIRIAGRRKYYQAKHHTPHRQDKSIWPARR